MRVHFIAIGGAVMHNLAITLHKKGYTVTGSDDEMFSYMKSQKYSSPVYLCISSADFNGYNITDLVS